MTKRDPYEVLGVSASASDAEVRAAYHRLVQLHHPDHNGGSAEAGRRFEEVQEAYAAVKALRAKAGVRPSPGPPPPPVDPDLESRLARMEHDLREAHLARERAARAAREAAAENRRRPTDEELGYVTTDDSLSKILADASAELADRFAQARDHPAAERVGALIDELAEKLTGRRPPRG